MPGGGNQRLALVGFGTLSDRLDQPVVGSLLVERIADNDGVDGPRAEAAIQSRAPLYPRGGPRPRLAMMFR